MTKRYFFAALALLMLVAGVQAEDSGYVIVHALGVTVQDPYVYISNDDKIFANLSWLPDHSEAYGDLLLDNPGMLLIKLKPDGYSETLHMAAGNYTAYMRQGNADQPETRTFLLANGWTEHVVFQGAAYASGDEGCCACHNVTVVDVPGRVIHHPEINHTIMHPAGIEVITIIDEPAWVEIKHHDDVTHTECYPEINRTVVHQNTTRQDCTVYDHTDKTVTRLIDGVWIVIGHWSHAFCKDYHGRPGDICEEQIITKCVDVDNMDGYISTEIIAPSRCNTIVDTEGWDEIIQHPVITHTETRTVGEPWYELIVDRPAYDEQVGAISHEERVCGQKLVCPCGCVM